MGAFAKALVELGAPVTLPARRCCGCRVYDTAGVTPDQPNPGSTAEDDDQRTRAARSGMHRRWKAGRVLSTDCYGPGGSYFRIRLALATTVTELKAMAAPANIGESSIPSEG